MYVSQTSASSAVPRECTCLLMRDRLAPSVRHVCTWSEVSCSTNYKVLNAFFPITGGRFNPEQEYSVVTESRFNAPRSKSISKIKNIRRSYKRLVATQCEC